MDGMDGVDGMGRIDGIIPLNPPLEKGERKENE